MACYALKTTKGMFYIRQITHRWHVFFEDENLGSYISPQQAAEDLAHGHTFTASCGDTSKLGLPDDITRWQRSL